MNDEIINYENRTKVLSDDRVDLVVVIGVDEAADGRESQTGQRHGRSFRSPEAGGRHQVPTLRKVCSDNVRDIGKNKTMIWQMSWQGPKGPWKTSTMKEAGSMMKLPRRVTRTRI